MPMKLGYLANTKVQSPDSSSDNCRQRSLIGTQNVEHGIQSSQLRVKHAVLSMCRSLLELPMVSISKKIQHSSTSFVISLSVHLAILLCLSVFWVTGNYSKSILLDGFSIQNSFDDEFLNPLTIELPESTESLALNSSQLEPSTEPGLALATDVKLDWSELANVPVELASDLNQGAFEGATEPISTALMASSQKSGFFGIHPTGDRIVYVIDISSSMSQGMYQSRIERAIIEVIDSVDQLKPEQEFHVQLFCFQNAAVYLGSKRQDYYPATDKNKELLREWLQTIRLFPGTDPREAMVDVLNLEPSCVFLLSDGEFNGQAFQNGRFGGNSNVAGLARKFNKSNCPINTIGLEDVGSQFEMKTIAKDSGGVYRFVPAEEQ